ncbi:hypothetical protein V6N13_073112 [Hibiscus sabdariffa]
MLMEVLTYASHGVVAGWRKPKQMWVKLNVDGVVRPSNGAVRPFDGAAGIGGLFDPILVACGYHKVEVESNCCEVVQCVKTADAGRVGNALFIVIHEMLKLEWEVALMHVDRESNTVVVA